MLYNISEGFCLGIRLEINISEGSARLAEGRELDALKRHLFAVAHDDDIHRLISAVHYLIHELISRVHRHAADRHYFVALFKPCGAFRFIGKLRDGGRCQTSGGAHEYHHAKHADKYIRQRPRKDGEYAPPHALVAERVWVIGFLLPADGKKAQRIAYTALFRHTAEDLRPHSNRKFLDSDAVGACDKKVTALVNEHEYSEYKYRKNEIKYSHLFSLCALSAHRS